MKLLKLIPAAAIVLTAFTAFEAKAGMYPDGWTEMNSCFGLLGYKYFKLQKTDTPASYGTYQRTVGWVKENVSNDCATSWYQYKCQKKSYS